MSEVASTSPEEESKFTNSITPDELEGSPITEEVEYTDAQGGVRSKRRVRLSPETTRLYAAEMADSRVMPWLLRLKSEHRETYDHSIGVTSNVLALAEINQAEAELNESDLKTLARAALLHDVGKLDSGIKEAVSSDIDFRDPRLSKEQKQKAEEYKKRIAAHPQYSVDRIMSEFADDKLMLALIMFHHDLQPNSLYNRPDETFLANTLGLSEDQTKKLDFMKQIFEVADKFDAITSPRSYKDQVSDPAEAARGLEASFVSAGGDRKYVDQILALYYPNTATDSPGRFSREFQAEEESPNESQ